MTLSVINIKKRKERKARQVTLLFTDRPNSHMSLAENSKC